MKLYKNKWWHSNYLVITSLVLALFLPVIALFSLVLILIQQHKQKTYYKYLITEDHLINKPIQEKIKLQKELEENLEQLTNKIEINNDKLSNQQEFIAEIKKDAREIIDLEMSEKINSAESKASQIIEVAEENAKEINAEAEGTLSSLLKEIKKYSLENEELSSEQKKLLKETNRYKNQARKYKSDLVGLKNFNEKFPYTINFSSVESGITEIERYLDDDNLLGTVVKAHLHLDNSKELRKLSKATNKEIENVLERYETRYSTKANKTIYHLMVIGLRAELQLLLLELKYNKLDESIDIVKDIIKKYLTITSEGNQSILSTITRFLSEIEPLFVELVQIEYKYYVYREKEKEEQRLIKEQMRQEAEEKKRLAEEKKKLDKEEDKFKNEMKRNQDLLQNEIDQTKVIQYKERIKELEKQMLEIEEKKEEISNLALGKAGYVYVISNLGSFGDQMFKIGMTRRMVPQDRIDELGSASVPFKFDIHALVFSENAVSLEQKIHKMLQDERVNKVNYRKEFFKTDLTKLRNVVEEIDPTVEFITTMLAEEYNQTKSMEESLVS